MDLVLVDEEISDRVIEVKEGESLNLNLAAFKAFPAVKIDIKVARNATLTAVFADFSKGEGRFVLNVYLEDEGASFILGFDRIPVTSVDNKVDYSKLGDYQITYSYENRGKVQTVSRSVHLVDTVIPVLTLDGGEEMDLEYGDEFADPGYLASDDYDGNITSQVTIENGMEAGKMASMDSRVPFTELIRALPL